MLLFHSPLVLPPPNSIHLSHPHISLSFSSLTRQVKIIYSGFSHIERSMHTHTQTELSTWTSLTSAYNYDRRDEMSTAITHSVRLSAPTISLSVPLQLTLHFSSTHAQMHAYTHLDKHTHNQMPNALLGALKVHRSELQP